MLHSIVAATDQSPESVTALAWSESLAEANSAHLRIVDLGSVSSHEIADQVAAAANEVEADLIVLPSVSDGGVTHGPVAVIGDIAHHLAHPVAVVHDDRRVDLGARVVVGVDGSDGSAAALGWGRSLAESLGGEVTAVFVHDALADSYPHSPVDDWKYQGQLEVERIIAEANAEDGPPVRLEARAGGVVEELISAGEELAPSIVVAGTRSHGLPLHHSLGHVPTGLLRSAAQPVVLVPLGGLAATQRGSSRPQSPGDVSDSQRRRPIIDRVEARIDEATTPRHPVAPRDAGGAISVGTVLAEQERESRDAFGPVTKGQVRGVMYGGAVGAVVGALVTFGLGFISWGAGVAVGWRILACALIGAFAGATGGAVYWGGRLPELEGEVSSADHTPSLSGSSLSDPTTDDRGR